MHVLSLFMKYMHEKGWLQFKRLHRTMLSKFQKFLILGKELSIDKSALKTKKLINRFIETKCDGSLSY